MHEGPIIFLTTVLALYLLFGEPYEYVAHCQGSTLIIRDANTDKTVHKEFNHKLCKPKPQEK